MRTVLYSAAAATALIIGITYLARLLAWLIGRRR